MKGQDNLLKIKLGCSRRPKKKRKKMNGKKKRCVVLLPVTRTWRNIYDTRVLKRLKKAKIVKGEFEKGCWWTHSKGTAQRTGWGGDSWPLSLRWRSPHTCPYCRTSGDIPEDFWKTVCSWGGGEGTGGSTKRTALMSILQAPQSLQEKCVGVNRRYQCLLWLIEIIFSGDLCTLLYLVSS